MRPYIQRLCVSDVNEQIWIGSSVTVALLVRSLCRNAIDALYIPWIILLSKIINDRQQLLLVVFIFFSWIGSPSMTIWLSKNDGISFTDIYSFLMNRTLLFILSDGNLETLLFLYRPLLIDELWLFENNYIAVLCIQNLMLDFM